MSEIFLVFPNQLYQEITKVPDVNQLLIIEDYLFFKQFRFHQQKLVFHRASMRFYQSYLRSNNYSVLYLESKNSNKTLDLFEYLPEGVSKIHCWESDDDYLSNFLQLGAKKRGLEIEFHTTPSFLIDLKSSTDYLHKSGRLFQSNFYQHNRKKLQILMDRDKPQNGKWSFDQENRKKTPKSLFIPKINQIQITEFQEEALVYVQKNFPDNYGQVTDFNYPTDYQSANAWLEDFFEQRFENYGKYQDAIVADNAFNFHSVISPLINVGLLSPKDVIERAIIAAEKYQIEFNNLEGFIRQIIGWREYVRAVYHLVGRKQRTTNFWNHTRKIPESFWNASTNILPVDDSIKKTLKYSYTHHIERLMIMSNFMTLCEFDPNEVYQWFMELFIDAYDWVMVPNVYGMGLYADGGLIVTKPYISSSNYIKKMSHYPDGPWAEIWDGLYWRFIDKHQSFFNSNPRLSMMTLHLKKMPAVKLAKHLETAEEFLNNLK